MAEDTWDSVKQAQRFGDEGGEFFVVVSEEKSTKGGQGSGNFGHSGRPGEVGGSGEGSGGEPVEHDQPKDQGAETASLSHLDPKTGEVDTSAVARLVSNAVSERPSRATHGNTSSNAFWIVGGRVYPYNEWRSIPEEQRRFAIAIHSHSPDNWKEWEAREGKPNPLSPPNAADIKTWLDAFRKGQGGAIEGVILADGRMTLLQLTERTDMKVFRTSQKALEKELHRPYVDRSAYYEAHKSEADYDEYRQDRELLGDWAQRNGITYHENLRWREGETMKTSRRQTAKQYTPPSLEHWDWPVLESTDENTGWDTLAVRLEALRPKMIEEPSLRD